MDAREYLSQAYEVSKKIKRISYQLDSVKSDTTYTAPVYGDVKVQTNMKSSAVESAAIRRVALENALNEAKEELRDVSEEISSTIKRVGDSNMESLLEMRYLSFMDWDTVFNCMGYSRSYVFKLHRQALRRVKTLI